MRRNELFWGGALVLVGIALLFGIVLRVNVWVVIGPLFLVALGLWIIWGASGRLGTVPAESATIPLEGATQARIELHHGGGLLTIGGGAGSGELLTGSFVGGLKQTVRREGERMDVDLHVAQGGWPWVWGTAGLAWDMRLSPDVPLTLKLETGGGETRADLTDLKVTDLRLSTGASSTEVILPARAGFTRVKAGAGAASVRFRVPEGVAVKFEFEGGLATVNVDTNRFPRVGDEYCSPDYETAANKVDIEVDAGVGSVDLR
jgi:hypothetical protein